MKDFEKVAVAAARLAGKLQKENYLKTDKSIFYKGEINIVTETDLESEKIIKDTILADFPDHSILAEESDETVTSSNYRWIIDPLDGTTNFSHGYPCFCISIALEKDKEIILGVIFDPVKDELFVARKGQGAYLNDKKIHVSNVDKLTRSLLVTGFPYDIRKSGKNNFEYFFKMSMTAQAVRRDGSAAIDLAYVACGRFDGFWELKLAPWDVAAGILLVEEAGGKISGIDGQKVNPWSREMLASNGIIHTEMIAVFKGVNNER